MYWKGYKVWHESVWWDKKIIERKNSITLVVYEHSRLGAAHLVGYQLIYYSSSWNNY